MMQKIRQKIGCVLLSVFIILSGSVANAGRDDYVGIWRVQAPKLTPGKWPFSVMEDKGGLQRAIPDSKKRYLFSDTPAGARPLVIIGTMSQILEEFSYHVSCGHTIVNLMDELGNKIYIGVALYKPKKQFTMVDPLGDAVTRAIVDAMGFIPTPDIADAATHIGSFGQFLYRKLMEYKDRKNSFNDKVLYLKIGYLQEEGMNYIENKELTFEELLNEVQRITLETLAKEKISGQKSS